LATLAAGSASSTPRAACTRSSAPATTLTGQVNRAVLGFQMRRVLCIECGTLLPARMPGMGRMGGFETLPSAMRV
jgi:hypothetical protein